MKNRRIAIIAFMLVAVLLIGVGYAAVSRTLQITGSAYISAVKASEFDVTFTEPLSTTPDNENANEVAPSAETNTIASSGHEVMLSVVGFETVGDKLVLTYTVKYSTKKEGINAQLTTPVVTIANNAANDSAVYFKCTASFAANTLTADADSTVLTVEIELIAVPVEASIATITVTFNAEAVSASA